MQPTINLRWKVCLLVLLLSGGTLTYYLQGYGLHPLQRFSFFKNDSNPGCSSELQQRLQANEVSYQAYIRNRKDFLGTRPLKDINPWDTTLNMYFWDYFLPTFSCPYTLQRIGTLGDGGKWICGMELFEQLKTNDGTDESAPKSPPPCIIYSFGVAGESSFEREFLSRTPCHIWAYDASVNGMGPQVKPQDPRVHFSRIYLSASKGRNTTLGALMKQNGHDRIDFIKMDIEGSEFGVIEQILDTFEILPFSHLNVEIHVDHGGHKFPSMYKLWERLEAKGLRAFKNEINHNACVNARINPTLIEYSFINIKGPSRLVPSCN